MYNVYVLESEDGKLYKGLTNNLKRRLREHLSNKTITTSRMRNPKLVYCETFEKFNEARERELYFKTAAGRRYLKNKINLVV